MGRVVLAIAVTVLILSGLGYWAISLTASVPISAARVAGPFAAFAGGGLVLIVCFVYLVLRGRR